MARVANCGAAWRSSTRLAAYQPLSTVEMNWPVSDLPSRLVPPGPVIGSPVVVSYQLSRKPFHFRSFSIAPRASPSRRI